MEYKWFFICLFIQIKLVNNNEKNILKLEFKQLGGKYYSRWWCCGASGRCSRIVGQYSVVAIGSGKFEFTLDSQDLLKGPVLNIFFFLNKLMKFFLKIGYNLK